MYAYIHRFSRFCLGEAESDRTLDSNRAYLVTNAILANLKEEASKLCSTLLIVTLTPPYQIRVIAIVKLENC